MVKKVKKIFFSPNKESAVNYASRVNFREGRNYFEVKSIKLARKQMFHVDGWKTWESD
jgi:hypothetical protein